MAFTEIEQQVINEIHRYLCFNSGSALVYATVGSWKKTCSDQDVLDTLKYINDKTQEQKKNP